jgi:hypothetical protein
MNHSKIAAALHALAEAFEGVLEEVAPAKTVKGKVKAAEQQTAAASAAASVAAAPSIAAAAPVAVEPAVPPAPAITKDQLNKAVLKVAAKSRDVAESILAKFGAKNTVTLPQEQWQAVYDAFEEEIAKQDAAAVQVQQASLV